MANALRKTFVLLAASTACAIPAPSRGADDVQLTKLQNELRSEITTRCLPQFDGDKRKGELTNADLPALLDARGLYNLWPSEGLLDGHARDAFAGARSQRYVYCIDTRLRGLHDAWGNPVHAVFFVGQKNNDDYRPVRVIALSPVAPIPTQPRASMQVVMIDAAQHIRYIHRTLPKDDGVNPNDVYERPVGIPTPLPDFASLARWRVVVGDAQVLQASPTPPARPLF